MQSVLSYSFISALWLTEKLLNRGLALSCGLLTSLEPLLMCWVDQAFKAKEAYARPCLFWSWIYILNVELYFLCAH